MSQALFSLRKMGSKLQLASLPIVFRLVKPDLSLPLIFRHFGSTADHKGKLVGERSRLFETLVSAY